MVKFLFHFSLSLLLIVLQTSVLPPIPFFESGFDLLIIMVLFFSLMFSHPALFLAVFLIGWSMDCLSAAPVGLYTAAYLWIFITVLILKRFVHPGNLIFLPMISAFAVMMENGFLFFSFFVRYGISAISIPDLFRAGSQILWAFFMVPMAIILIDALHKKCDNLDAKTL